MVDKNGFLLAIMVTVGNIHHSKATELLMRTLVYFLNPVKIILADGRYRRDYRTSEKKFGYPFLVFKPFVKK